MENPFCAYKLEVEHKGSSFQDGHTIDINCEGQNQVSRDQCNKNIATGETSQAITPYHFFNYFNFFGFYH